MVDPSATAGTATASTEPTSASATTAAPEPTRVDALAETKALLERQRRELLEHLGEHQAALPEQQRADVAHLAGELRLAGERLARVIRERETCTASSS